jgi:hypothetical protein
MTEGVVQANMAARFGSGPTKAGTLRRYTIWDAGKSVACAWVARRHLHRLVLVAIGGWTVDLGPHPTVVSPGAISIRSSRKGAVARHVASVSTPATDFCDTKSGEIPLGRAMSQNS